MPQPTRTNRFDEAGDTLVEVLIAVLIASMAVIGILGALLTSTSSSISHRNMTTFDAVLKSFAETARNAIETQTSTPYACPAPSPYYQVAGPLIPSSGPPGTPVGVLGTGFTASGGTYAGATFNGSAITSAAAPSSSTSGAITTFSVPSSLPAGTYSVVPFGNGVNNSVPAGSDFTITPYVGAVSPVNPASLGPGTQVSFGVKGFAATSPIRVTVGGTTYATGFATDATGANTTVKFTIPNGLSGVQQMTVLDSAPTPNTAPSVPLNVSADTAPANPVPLSSALSTYQLTSSTSYWTGNSGSLTTTSPSDSSPLWSSNPSYCATGPNQELLSFHLFNNQPGNSGGDFFSVVVGSPNALKQTATSISASSINLVVGQVVTYTATVTVTSGGGTPPLTDTVTFIDGGTSPITCGAGSQAFDGTTAKCTQTYASAGTHSVTALFNGDVTFAGSMSPIAVTETVNPWNTTTSVASSSNPSVVGQAVTYTATVTVQPPGTGAPNGNVKFLDGGTPIASCGGASGVALNGASPDTATCTVTTYNSTGSHTITAQYLGSVNYSASTSLPLTQTVSKAGATTSVASNTNPSVTGQQVTYTATVTANAPGSGSPTGNVEFFDGGTAIASCGGAGGAALSSSSPDTATCTVTYTSTGSHTITAQYLGDTNYNSSVVSPSITQTVNKANTTASVSGNPNPATRKKGTVTVTYSANVAVSSPGAGTPTGSIEFFDGGTAIASCGGASGVTISGGTATCSIAYTTAGSHTITVKYLGDSNFNASPVSTPLTETIQ